MQAAMKEVRAYFMLLLEFVARGNESRFAASRGRFLRIGVGVLSCTRYLVLMYHTTVYMWFRVFLLACSGKDLCVCLRAACKSFGLAFSVYHIPGILL